MKTSRWLFFFTFLFFVNNVFSMLPEELVMDVHTGSNYKEVPIDFMNLDLDLNLDEKFFSGFVDLHLKNDFHPTRKLVVDTKFLDILNVEKTSKKNASKADFSETAFKLSDDFHNVLGRQLVIDIDEDTKIVRVSYKTTEKSTGIDWIPPSFTQSKKPMVVTQFQAINARTFVPCQDTPAQKIKYDATIRLKTSATDKDMRVVMATNKRRYDEASKSYHFSMTIPIPTYLIALNAGVFAERVISPRVSVFAEPALVDAAAFEFAEAEDMVKAAESLFGPYDWERFDIIVQPKTFSYGGMENPTLTSIGPTVLAGDKSMVGVIAHELGHSWAGNKVGNETWDDFWINEGTTMYIERAIMAKIKKNYQYRDLSIVEGQKVLMDDLVEVKAKHGLPLTRLGQRLDSNFDPDDAVSFIPYEKGFNFWLALEQAYGQETVIAFLKGYFAEYAFSTMNTAKLKRLIESYEGFNGAKKINLDNWLYGDDLPLGGLPKVTSELLVNVDNIIEQLSNSEGNFDVGSKVGEDFCSEQWSYFLRNAVDVPPKVLMNLEKTHKLTTKNDEIRFNFFKRAIESGLYEVYRDDIDKFLDRVGRIKYVKPIYVGLTNINKKELALELFEKHKASNNHITNGSIARFLGVELK